MENKMSKEVKEGRVTKEEEAKALAKELKKAEEKATPLSLVRLKISSSDNLTVEALFREIIFPSKDCDNSNIIQNLEEYGNDKEIIVLHHTNVQTELRYDSPDVTMRFYMCHRPYKPIAEPARLQAVLSFSEYHLDKLEGDHPRRDRYKSIVIAEFDQKGLTSELISNCATYLLEELRKHLARRGVKQ